MIVVLLIAAVLLVITLILLFLYYMIYGTPEKVSHKSLGIDDTDFSSDKYGFGPYDEPQKISTKSPDEKSHSKELDYEELEWALYKGGFNADDDFY